jgi:hypothetical protein
VVSCTLRPLLLQEHSLWYCKRLGEHRSRSRRYGGKKNLLLLSRIKPRFLCRSARSVVSVPTELSVLLVFSKYEFTFRIRTGCSELGFCGLSRNMQYVTTTCRPVTCNSAEGTWFSSLPMLCNLEAGTASLNIPRTNQWSIGIAVHYSQHCYFWMQHNFNVYFSNNAL